MALFRQGSPGRILNIQVRLIIWSLPRRLQVEVLLVVAAPERRET